MTKQHIAWLAVKRFLRLGWFSTIIADKCDSHWTEVECPNPPTWKEFYRGQFGHKVTLLFCDECLAKHDLREDHYKEIGFEMVSEGRKRIRI